MLLKGKTKEQVEDSLYRSNLRNKLQEDLKYLSDTDWYITRQAELQKEIPQEILSKRQECRDTINRIRLLLVNE